MSRRVTLAARPNGEPREEDFRIEDAAVPEPGPGEVLVRALYVSVDPYQRGRMSEARSYAAPADGVPTENVPRRREEARRRFAHLLEAVTSND